MKQLSLPRLFVAVRTLTLVGLIFASLGTGCTATVVDDEEAAADIETREQALRVGDEIPNPDGEGDCKGSTNPDGCVDCWAQRDESCIECGGEHLYCCRHPDKCDVLNEPTDYRPPTGGTVLGGSGGLTVQKPTTRSW